MDRRRSSVIVPEIYKATVDSSHWDFVLETVAKITNSKTACLYHLDKNVGMVNAIDCRDPNTLYVAELMNWRVQKLTLQN